MSFFEDGGKCIEINIKGNEYPFQKTLLHHFYAFAEEKVFSSLSHVKLYVKDERAPYIKNISITDHKIFVMHHAGWK